MSTIIDQRIVEMQFDNGHFEKNVQTSLSTLDKLKQSLNLTGAAKGLDGINTAAERCNMSGLSNAVETVRTKFSALQVMGVTALANITNSAVNAGQKIANALTIEPLKTGMQEYETQINAVQTILANTQSKGSTLQDVNAALDELNKYADRTIYNFTEMTRNIGTFTAAGVDLETSVSSIKGIANLAAVSGSTSQQASNAMYQLSQALAAGKVSLMDWNSVVNAGMGGEVFQTALKRTAKQMGTNVDAMIEKYGSFRESLTKGEWLTTEVLTETLTQLSGAYSEADLIAQGYTEKQAKDIVKLAETASGAATDVKTFTQLVDTTKESVQSGWTQSWEIIIGDFQEAKKLWSEVSEILGGVINSSSEARNKLLSGGLSSGWKQLIGAGIADEEGYKEIFTSLAKDHGVALDEMIKKEGSFEEAIRAGLKNGSLNADMFTTSVYKMAEKMRGMSDEERKAAGYTEEHIKAIEELDNGLKNGTISMDEFVEKMTRLSGRENLIKALRNAFDGLMSVVTPVKEAFREVFPPMTAEQLYNITERIRDLTEKFKLTNTQSEKLKSTFKGTFSIIKMGVDVATTIGSGLFKLLGSMTGIGGGILTVTGSFGEWISGLTESISITESLSKAFDVAAKYLEKFTSFIGEKIMAPGYEGFLKLMKSLWDIISKIAIKISGLTSKIGNSLSNMFQSGDISAGLDILNGGLLAGVLLGLKKYIKNIAGPFDEIGGLFSNVKEIFDNVRGSLETYQKNLQAGTLMKIAGAVAILAGSIALIAMINPEHLAGSLGAITVLFADLMASMAIFNTIGGKYLRAFKAITVMIGISSAVLILAGALRVVATLDVEKLKTGMMGIVGLTAIVVAAAKVMATGNKTIIKGAGQMIVIAAALKIMASVLEDVSKFDWEQLKIGLSGVAAMMVGLAISMKLLNGVKVGVSTGASMVMLAGSMKIMASAVKDFSGLNWNELQRGLAGIGVALGAVTIAMNLMPKNMISAGAGLLIVSGALIVLVKALGAISSMTEDQLIIGLSTLGASMVLLAMSLQAMTGTLAGSAALLIAVGSLAALVPILKALSGMTWVQIVTGLVAIATTFTILGVAGWALAPAVPTILALAGAITLLGMATLAIGGGLALIATGIGTLAVSLAGGATAIAAGVTTIGLAFAGLIPVIVARLGEAIVVLCNAIADSATAIGSAVKAIVISLIDVLVECVPVIADGVLKLIVGVLEALVKYSPQIIDLIFQFAIDLLNGFADRLPELIQAAVNVLSQFFNGIIDALSGIDSTTIVNTILAVGFLSVLFMALSALSSMIPAAMTGVLGMGLLIVELGLVLAAIGALAQIPGLQWLIDQGGEFLQTVGNAIGKFVGGIAGGFAEGVSSSFPQIAKDLSEFMTNLQPFINGAKNIDSTMAEGVKALASTILILTAADILDGIASWITGGSSMSKFAEELLPFGKALKEYSNEVAGVNSETVTNSIKAAEALVKVADIIPNTGGLAAIFAGDNDVATFGTHLVAFGKSMKSYAGVVSGLDSESVEASVKAAKSLVKMADSLPESGGLWSCFSADNDMSTFGRELSSFGSSLKSYGDKVSGVDISAINSSVTAARSIVGFIKGIGKLDTDGIDSLKNALSNLGKVNIKNFVNAFENASVQLTSTGVDMMTSLAKGVKSAEPLLVIASNTIMMNLITSLREKYTPMYVIGIELLYRFINGINHARPRTITVVNTMLSNMLSTIKAKYTTFYTMGSYLVSGFANGISANAYKAAAKARAMAAAASNAAKKELDEHSPSVVGFKIGSFFVLGFANGIEKTTKKSTDNSVKMGKDAKEGLKKGLEGTSEIAKKTGEKTLIEQEKANNESLKNQEDYWAKMLKARKKAEEKDLKQHKSYADELENQTDSLMNKSGVFDSITPDATDDPDAKIDGNRLAKNLKEQIEQLEKYKKVMASLQTKLKDTSLWETVSEMGVDSMDKLQAINDMTNEKLSEYVKLYDKKYSLAKDTAVSQLSELKSESEKIEDEAFQKELLEFQEEILTKTKDKLASYTDELERNTDALMNRSRIFESVNEQEEVKASQLTTNLKAQVDQLEQYKTVMDSLQTKLSGTNLLSAVSEMGVDSLAQLEAIDGMTSRKLDEYIALYDHKYALAKGMAENQLTGLKTETEKELTELYGGSAVNLDEFMKAFDGTFQSISEYVAKSVTVGGEMSTGISQGIAENAHKVTTETVTTVDTSINEGGKVAEKESPTVGKFLVLGFANGIDKNTFKAEARAKAMAEAALAAARDALGVASPSKEFYKVGNFAGLGFTNALYDYGKKSYKAGSEMATAAKNGLSYAIRKVQDVINSDMDVQPTIRPVIDLSDVRAGAGLISDMFGLGAPVATLANVGAINSMMNRRLQNGVNDDIISAIDNLSRKLGNISGDTYQINGVTYDDGSNISEAVKALVRAARVERRV